MTTAPVFFHPAIKPGELRLDGVEGRHAAGSLRLTAGERLDLVDGTGRRGQGVVLVVHGHEAVTVGVTAVVDEAAPAPAFVVVQALPKTDRGELAVELMTEAGVDEIIPWSATRCVTRWSGERGHRSLAKWRSTASGAANQSRRARWPVVSELASTAEIVRRCRRADACFLLHESAERPLAVEQLRGVDEIVVIVGPEGGVDPAEVEQLAAAGARPVRLGSEILRTSTAGVLALAVLSSKVRWAA